jgi:hypothetical protein
MSGSLHTRCFSILLFDYQIRLTGFRTRCARLTDMDLARMTITDVEALLLAVAGRNGDQGTGADYTESARGRAAFARRKAATLRPPLFDNTYNRLPERPKLHTLIIATGRSET